MFIHIQPEETQTLDRIPPALLFPAPGLPKGHVLLGYDEQGHCPMLIDDKCSIYEHRPQTCRDYDCRVFAATGVAVDQRTQAEIAQRVKAWEFQYASDEGREEHRLVQRAAAFLQEKGDLFPHGSLPRHPVQLAVLAVRIYRYFCGPNVSALSDAAIAQAILAELAEKQF